MLRRVVLQNRSSANISFSDVTAVASALQIQTDRDFTPVWGVQAQITALNKGDAVPHGVWPVYIVNKPEGGLGIHLDKNHKPYAQVKDTSDWSVTASHELLEMLVDPYGHKFIKAPDIAPSSDGHLVNYLVEVADPCEVYEYSISGIAVSDFVTPEYYNPHPTTGAEFDFMRRLTKPLQVPPGCYISWIDPEDGQWHQKQPDGTFTRSHEKASPTNNPRDDRDHAFRDDETRHDLPAIRAAFAQRQSGHS
jgi:hypothetical protein